MSITDELREWAQGFNGPWKANEQAINAIADRIDERVKNIRSNEHHKGYQDGIMDGCSHYDPERTECTLSEEHGYIKLPVDADGVPIHIGDVMECSGEIFEVKFIRFNGEFWSMNVNGWNPAATRHHRKPTVEDVLDEFASAYDRIGGEDEEHQKYLNLIAEYAKRLTLADGEEA